MIMKNYTPQLTKSEIPDLEYYNPNENILISSKSKPYTKINQTAKIEYLNKIL